VELSDNTYIFPKYRNSLQIWDWSGICGEYRGLSDIEKEQW
jgi:hypothetical protein